MFLDLAKFALEVLVYGYCGCLMDFQGLEEIDREIVVSVLKLFVCRKRKKEEKYTSLVSRK